MQESSAALRAQVRELRHDCGGWRGRPCAPYPLVSQDRTFSLTHAAIDISFETSWPHESHHAELGGFSIGGSEIRSGGRASGRLFPGPLGSPEASSAAGPRAAVSCARACGRGGWLPPSLGLSSRRVSRNGRGELLSYFPINRDPSELVAA